VFHDIGIISILLLENPAFQLRSFNNNTDVELRGVVASCSSIARVRELLLLLKKKKSYNCCYAAWKPPKSLIP